MQPSTAQPSSAMILVIEDEEKLAEVLCEYLHQANFSTRHLNHGDLVMPFLQQQPVDLIVLDLNLPGTDGVELCQQIRQISNVPIIMATARVDKADRLKGLNIGADDYVCKPYSLREMVARVKVVLRRMQPITMPVKSSTSHGFNVNEEKMQIHYDGCLLDLTPVEYRLLNHLLARPEVVFSRDDLLNALYTDYRMVSARTVDSHIKNLRKKLQPLAPNHDLIKSIYGIGYKLESNCTSNIT